MGISNLIGTTRLLNSNAGYEKGSSNAGYGGGLYNNGTLFGRGDLKKAKLVIEGNKAQMDGGGFYSAYRLI